MGKFIYTFKRYEKKYILSKEKYDLLLAIISRYMHPDDYGETVICSLYCDTPDYLLIRRSLDKPIYKEKLRIRCYGVPKENSTAFIEIKKKFKKIVYKRRLDTTYAEAVNYIKTGSLEVEGQIKNELDWFRQSYNGLAPTVALFYTRTAYIDNEGSELRITLDKDLMWRKNELDLTLGAYGEPLLEKDEYLMEIKIPGAMPIWLANTLSELEIFPISYSKYGNAFRSFLKEISLFGGNKNA